MAYITFSSLNSQSGVQTGLSEHKHIFLHHLQVPIGVTQQVTGLQIWQLSGCQYAYIYQSIHYFTGFVKQSRLTSRSPNKSYIYGRPGNPLTGTSGSAQQSMFAVWQGNLILKWAQETLTVAFIRRLLQDSALRYRIWILGGSVGSKDLDSMILVGPFQLGIFHGSMILWFHLPWWKLTFRSAWH